MLRQRNAENLSVKELEQLLRIKRRESRIERFQQLSRSGRTVSGALANSDVKPRVLSPVPNRAMTSHNTEQNQQGLRRPSLSKSVSAGSSHTTLRGKTQSKRPKKGLDKLLLGVEVIALLTLFGVIISSYFSLQALNAEAATAQQTLLEQQQVPAPAPAAAFNVLPGGHSSPIAEGGSVPDVPLHLQQWVQPGQEVVDTNIAIESAAQAPTRIIIPKIKVDAPIVQGVHWEDLKKGVGHLPGSANPGERGNLYLAAHNDIYGEIFRYLEELEPGDEYFIHAGTQQFRYIVTTKRIIEPSEVEVMLPTTEPVATLQTCYPYLIDTHRLVVISELAE